MPCAYIILLIWHNEFWQMCTLRRPPPQPATVQHISITPRKVPWGQWHTKASPYADHCALLFPNLCSWWQAGSFKTTVMGNQQQYHSQATSPREPVFHTFLLMPLPIDPAASQRQIIMALVFPVLELYENRTGISILFLSN